MRTRRQPKGESRMIELPELLAGQRDGYRPWRVEKMIGSRKALYAAVVIRVFLLVGRRNGGTVRIVSAKLGEGNIVENRGLRELGARNRYEQRLHHQCIDRKRADQPSPERSRSRTRLIWSVSHAHKSITRCCSGFQIRSGSSSLASRGAPTQPLTIDCKTGLARLALQD